MSEQLEDVHITADQLAVYYEGELSEDVSAVVEEHLAECAECISTARNLYSVSLAWDRWLEARRLELSAGNIVADAVDAALSETTDPKCRERLKNWSERWRGRVEGVVRIVVGSGANASLVLTGGLQALLRPQALWRFELAPAPSFGAVRGPSDSTASPVAFAAGKPAAKVAVSGEAEEIEVRIDNMPAGEASPLVLLCPVTGRQPPRVGELRHVPGTTYWIARFEHIAQGDYLVVFEPMEYQRS